MSRTDQTLYELTDEHRARLPEWRDRWIAIALRTRPMTATDRRLVTTAIRGMYRAAGLDPAPVIYVPSPIVGAIAWGVASAIWYLREHDYLGRRWREEEIQAAARVTIERMSRVAHGLPASPPTRDATAATTRAATRDATDAATSAATRKATIAATVDVTMLATHDATIAATRAATAAATHAATAAATHAATNAATRAATDAATRKATIAATRDATRDDTSAALSDATRDATYTATAAATAAATHDATIAATRAATDAATRKATIAATRDATYTTIYAVMRDATRDDTSDATDATTRAATHDATAAATRDATSAATRDATSAATRAATRSATDAATRAATDAATIAATRGATYDDTISATRSATYDATDAATSDATRDATYAATRSATYVATDAATSDATRAAARVATYAATYDDTSAATDAATSAATDAATSDDTVASRVGADVLVALMTGCCAKWPSGWDAANHWSGWVGYLSFFRHVARLPIDYSAWRHYETAAERSSHRYMHRRFCLVSDFPAEIHRDGQHAPHAEHGPALRWSDGWSIYRWHGQDVPREWIEDRASLDPTLALTHPQVELRRCVAEIVGWERVLSSLSPRTIDADSDPTIGTLLEVDLPDAPASRFLRVQCGTGRTFVLSVPPEPSTARAANAWTYGLDASQYAPEVRT